MKKNLRSEAAIKRVLEDLSDYWSDGPGGDGVIFIRRLISNEVVAEIDLREVIKKRKPLTGIKKQVEKIVRGSKVKTKRRK